MAYQTPRTWIAGDHPTAAQFNQDIRDNQLAAFPLGVAGWTSYTPTLVQLAAVTKTVTYAKYIRVGRLIVAAFDLTATAAGTIANNVLVGLPVACAAGTGLHLGPLLIYDASTTTRYNGNAELTTTTTIALSYNQASANFWGVTPALALASGDIIRGTVTYEAAT